MADVVHFDRETVLDRAEAVFVRKGFKSSTIKDLVKATGVSESSLYNSFGGKEALFVEVLDRYAEGIAAQLEVLRQPGSALAALRESWRLMCVDATTRNRGKGCLVTNSVVELAPHNRRVRARLTAIYERFENMFFETLERAKAQGEIAADADTRSMARFLLHSTQGIRVLSKVKPSQGYLDAITRVTMGALERVGVRREA